MLSFPALGISEIKHGREGKDCHGPKACDVTAWLKADIELQADYVPDLRVRIYTTETKLSAIYERYKNDRLSQGLFTSRTICGYGYFYQVFTKLSFIEGEGFRQGIHVGTVFLLVYIFLEIHNTAYCNASCIINLILSLGHRCLFLAADLGIKGRVFLK